MINHDKNLGKPPNVPAAPLLPVWVNLKEYIQTYFTHDSNFIYSSSMLITLKFMDPNKKQSTHRFSPRFFPISPVDPLAKKRPHRRAAAECDRLGTILQGLVLAQNGWSEMNGFTLCRYIPSYLKLSQVYGLCKFMTYLWNIWNSTGKYGMESSRNGVKILVSVPFRGLYLLTRGCSLSQVESVLCQAQRGYLQYSVCIIPNVPLLCFLNFLLISNSIIIYQHFWCF